MIISDPLAFQWLSKENPKCENVTFVDIDYQELIKKKCEAITKTPQLQDLLQPLDAPKSAGPILLRSKHYLALGCDLTNINGLESSLNSEFDVSGCLILCTAEVSVTYMHVEAADSLIAWAARYNNSVLHLSLRFIPCLTDAASTLLSA